ncbi:hypothetical protein N7457_003755 [Penicillium paradoxum]|uniref:uncharacterized protein n=1 Tax=Penicillium paradoxum TaxID=176176 RepID=UPI00254893A3|nr:uncharacterized protein N7457_003755 [Penicillium paradoxum]KAJ5788765.1 hypothetical protein N7457_003755 [Penicillium paradoxum]
MPWSFALPQAIFGSPILAVATPITAGTAVALLTNRKRNRSTYNQLQQPPYSPPGWLFAPAWTLLYGLMGYASHHATTVASQSFSLAARDAHTTAQTLYTTQLGLNFMWMPLFFRLGRPALALGDLTLLAGNVGALMANWWTGDRTAFWCLVPYAIWLGYAAYLNIGVGILNNWTLPQKERSE